jgi:hypothetical protein
MRPVSSKSFRCVSHWLFRRTTWEWHHADRLSRGPWARSLAGDVYPLLLASKSSESTPLELGGVSCRGCMLLPVGETIARPDSEEAQAHLARNIENGFADVAISKESQGIKTER